jgi:hypothetical protein
MSITTSISRTWLVLNSILALSFGISMFLVLGRSRSLFQLNLDPAGTPKAAGGGLLAGLLLLACGLLLGAFYQKAKPVGGGSGIRSILVTIPIATLAGGTIGATLFVPMLGDLAVLFLDYQGVILYFSGALGGSIGAVVGTIAGTTGLSWWVRVPLSLIMAVAGLPAGIFLAALFVALFTTSLV